MEVSLYNIDACFGRETEGVESINKKLLFRVAIGALRKERCDEQNSNYFRFVWANQD